MKTLCFFVACEFEINLADCADKIEKGATFNGCPFYGSYYVAPVNGK